MKYLLLVCAALMIPWNVYAAGYCGAWGSSGTNPWTVSSDSGGTASLAYADVNACVSNASAGDVINVPAGTEDWGTSQLSVSKAIKLAGAGDNITGATIITGSTTGAIITFATGSSNASFPFEMSGLEIHKATSPGSILLITGAGNGWRVHHNRLISGYKTIPNAIQINSHSLEWSTYGLIDSNYIYWGIIGVSGAKSSSAVDSWSKDAPFGTANAVYFENNIFDHSLKGSDATWNSAIDGNSGAPIVARYNTFIETFIRSHDACHNVDSIRSIEVYNNKFEARVGHYTNAYVWGQGGTYVITKNKVLGPYSISRPGKVYMDVRRSTSERAAACGSTHYCGDNTADSIAIDNYDDATGYKCYQQTGGGKIVAGKTTLDPVYIWNNTTASYCTAGTNMGLENCTTDTDCGDGGECYTTTNLPNKVKVEDNSTNFIKNNRDYYDEDCTGANCNVRSGWSPYDCPHPLAGLTGSCDTSSATMYGTTGYNVSSETDVTAPVPVISTSNSTIITDSLTVTGTSTDAVGVSGCKFRIGSAPDASNGTACTGTTSFSCATSGYASGANTLYVGCYDAAGNYGSDSIIVTFTPPTASGCSFSGVGMVR
jgi:hypothetical protein